MGQIEIKHGDILKQDVDAIVNPANRYMLHGGGLAALIASAGGPELIRASRRSVPVDTGKAIHTTAGKLPFKGVIHVVGPYWGGNGNEAYWKRNDPDKDVDYLLEHAHFSALRIAWEQGYKSIALPAISCGVFRFPVEQAAPIAIDAVRKALREYSTIERVVFCMLDDHHFDEFSKAYAND